MQDLKNRIIAGERAAIAKAITIVESSREEDIALSPVSYTHLTLPTSDLV